MYYQSCELQPINTHVDNPHTVYLLMSVYSLNRVDITSVRDNPCIRTSHVCSVCTNCSVTLRCRCTHLCAKRRIKSPERPVQWFHMRHSEPVSLSLGACLPHTAHRMMGLSCRAVTADAPISHTAAVDQT